MKRKTKQVLALTAVVLLVGLNILTLILGFSPNESLQKLAWPCFFLSWLFPLIIYVNLLLFDRIRNHKGLEELPAESDIQEDNLDADDENTAP